MRTRRTKILTTPQPVKDLEAELYMDSVYDSWSSKIERMHIRQARKLKQQLI